jgi:hypothetical protein
MGSAHPRSLWFGLLAGPIVWSVYFLIGYGLAEVACRTDALSFNLFSWPALAIAIIGLTLLALLITLYAGVLAYRNWRQAGDRSLLYYSEQELSERYNQFMAFAGILLNLLFGFVIFLTGLPAFFLQQPCIY